MTASERKIVTDAAQLPARLAELARPLVFTNGCFDILHRGHVAYLEEAAALGQSLVVGVNSDASVRRVKGPTRPIVAQDERAELIAALACVDLAVIFEDDTPLSLIEAVAPDVLVKGGDWTPDQLVPDLIRAFTRGPLTHPVSIKTNTGDGLKMAMRVGAMLGNMREAWWMPVIEVPTDINPMGRQLLTYERTMPGSLMVNRSGKRFTNEASNYNAFGAAFHEQDVSRFQYANLPCWLIFDQTYVDTYGFRVSAGTGGDRTAEVIDIRPHVEVAVQLKALHAPIDK